MEVSIKPGCFGSPLCFSRVTPICKKCNFTPACEVAAGKRAVILSDKYNIKAIIASKVKPDKVITPVITKTVKRENKPKITFLKDSPKEKMIEKMVQDEYGKLNNLGLHLKDVVSSRNNTIPSNMFTHYAVGLLLDGAVTATSLSECFQNELKISKKPADYYADASIRMLIRSGAGVRERNSWTILPFDAVEVE